VNQAIPIQFPFLKDYSRESKEEINRSCRNFIAIITLLADK
jgi:hypothetical protein